jgi:hypothetical protein
MVDKPIIRTRPEDKLQDQIVQFLRDRGWLVEETHGNAYQRGLPDLFCWHPKYKLFRWVDVKVESRNVYTKAQCQKWPIWESFELGVWIMMKADDEWYQKLWEPPNFRDFWKPRYDKYLKSIEEVMKEEFPECGS